MIRRRELLTLLSGAAAAWPLMARAQQSVRVRRIGVLTNGTSDDPEGQARLGAFLQGLQEAGWSLGRNVRIDYRWGVGDSDRYRRFAAELVALAPDAILAYGGATVAALQQASRTVPIVFAGVVDPVGAGLVASLARPGGNATGFTTFEYGIAVKWLELLKAIAPNVQRAAVLRDHTSAAGISQFAAIQSAVPSFGVEVRPVSVNDANKIERAITTFARGPNGGLIMTATGAGAVHRDLIIGLAALHRLPAVYALRSIVVSGGLISYGTDPIDQYRRAASYVDRILRGEMPADLPVQGPVKYETVLNMKTARALGLEVPTSVRVRADELIE